MNVASLIPRKIAEGRNRCWKKWTCYTMFFYKVWFACQHLFDFTLYL